MFHPQMKKVLKNRWFLRLIGIGIFILILFQINWLEFARIIKQVNLYWILFSLFLQGVALLVTTLRWQLIMTSLDIHVTYIQSLTHQLIGTGVAIITPGQLGEFVKVLYHRQMNFPIPESALSILLDRLFDLAILLAFGIFSFAIFFGFKVEILIGTILVAGLIALTSILFFRKRQRSDPLVAQFLARFIPMPYKENVHQKLWRLVGEVGSISPVILFSCLLLSLVNFALLVVKVYLLAIAVQIRIPFWYLASAVPIFRLAGLIPISVSGIGTRDATIIYLLARAGVSTESALVFSLLGLITLEFQALVGMLLWWRHPPMTESKNQLFEGVFPSAEEAISEG
jgi:uncharacterized protein (TIRG00374 family)